MESFHSHDEKLSLKLLIVFSRAFHRVAEKLKEDIRSHNLNTTEFAVLELLYNKGDQPIRRNCPTDRRVVYATITDGGKQLMKEIFPKHKKAVQQIFQALSPEEKQILISLLKKLGFSLET
jgi:MarR family 2-MHQ and catechol resistance regulon transcriptional repressor